MPKITPYKLDDGQDGVIVEFEDGSSWAGYKSAYDEMTAASTLAANSAPTA